MNGSMFAARAQGICRSARNDVADGKTVMVMLDAKTAITRGKTKLDADAVKVGEQVVTEGIEEKEMIMAKTVKLGGAAATAKK